MDVSAVNTSGRAAERWALPALTLAALGGIALGRPAATLASPVQELVTAGGVAAVIVAAVLGLRFLRRMEQETAGAHSFAASVLEQIPLVTYVHELHGHTAASYASPQIEKLLGYPVRSWVDDADFFAKVIHPEDRDRVLAEHARAAAAHEHLRIDYRLIAADGRTVWVHDEAAIGFDDGRVTWRGFLLDITERRTTEDRLRASELRYRQIVETANEGIWVIGEGGTTLLANAEMARLLDTTADEMQGRPIAGFLDADELEFARRKREERRANRSETYEFTFRRKSDGEEVHTLVSATPLVGGDDEYVGTLAMITDVTELKRAEYAQLELAAIVESSTDAILVTDAEGIVRSWNASGERMYGYSAGEVVGRSVEVLLPPDRREEVAELRERVTRGEHVVGYETVRQRKDGTTVDVELTLAPLRDPDGEIRGISSVSRDVTDRKRLEQELQHAQKMEAVGQLAGGVAHDFNNSLMAIRGYTELLLGRLEESDPVRRHAEGIQKAAEGATSVTRQLLAFSRKQMLQPRVLDVNDVVDGLGGILRRLIGEHIALEVKPAPALGRVRADQGQLEQVLINFAVNARDAMVGGGRLTVETSNVEVDTAVAEKTLELQPGPYVLITVTDTGHGMPPEVRERVFEPFFSTKELGLGTGLGLSTVYGIVKQSGGAVWVYSEPDRGSSFKVYLPRIDAALREERVDDREIPGGDETILLVEDEDAVRSLVHEMLTARGYTVVEAATGTAALLMLKQNPVDVDLLLTDVVMPDMPGPQLAMRVGLLQPEARIVYMSGYTNDTALGHGALNTNVAFLQKPFSSADLARTVRASLDGGARTGAPNAVAV